MVVLWTGGWKAVVAWWFPRNAVIGKLSGKSELLGALIAKWAIRYRRIDFRRRKHHSLWVLSPKPADYTVVEYKDEREVDLYM